ALRRKNRGRDSRARRENADLHHAQRREKTLGPRPGGYFSGDSIRKTLGRHDRASGNREPVRRRSPAPGSTIERPGAVGRLVARRFGGACRVALRMEFVVDGDQTYSLSPLRGYLAANAAEFPKGMSLTLRFPWPP